MLAPNWLHQQNCLSPVFVGSILSLCRCPQAHCPHFHQEKKLLHQVLFTFKTYKPLSTVISEYYHEKHWSKLGGRKKLWALHSCIYTFFGDTANLERACCCNQQTKSNITIFRKLLLAAWWMQAGLRCALSRNRYLVKMKDPLCVHISTE